MIFAYKTLSIIRAAATDENVRKAHRVEIRLSHPDICPATSGDRASDVNVAYSLLRTLALREAYELRRPKSQALCSECKGTGGKRYPHPKLCVACGGEGYQ